MWLERVRQVYFVALASSFRSSGLAALIHFGNTPHVVASVLPLVGRHTYSVLMSITTSMYFEVGVSIDSNLVDSASSIRLSQRLSHACLSINKSIL